MEISIKCPHCKKEFVAIESEPIHIEIDSTGHFPSKCKFCRGDKNSPGGTDCGCEHYGTYCGGAK